MTGSVFNDERIKCLNSLMKSNRHTFFLGGGGKGSFWGLIFVTLITLLKLESSKLDHYFSLFARQQGKTEIIY